jgi:hypothetical protein
MPLRRLRAALRMLLRPTLQRLQQPLKMQRQVVAMQLQKVRALHEVLWLMLLILPKPRHPQLSMQWKALQ